MSGAQFADQPLAVSQAFKNTAVQSALYNASYWDMVLVDPTGGAVPIVLPSPATVPNVTVGVKNDTDSTNLITITTVSGLIDGVASKQINVARGILIFQSDGTNWFVTNLDGNSVTTLKDLRKVVIADETKVNVATEQDFTVLAIPANELVAGELLSVKADGQFTNDSATLANFRLRVRLGTLVLFDTGDLPVQPGVVGGDWRLEMAAVVRTIGATGNVRPLTGKARARLTLATLVDCDNADHSADVVVDTTAANDLRVTVQMSTADADISTTLINATYHRETV